MFKIEKESQCTNAEVLALLSSTDDKKLIYPIPDKTKISEFRNELQKEWDFRNNGRRPGVFTKNNPLFKTDSVLLADSERVLGLQESAAQKQWVQEYLQNCRFLVLIFQ